MKSSSSATYHATVKIGLAIAIAVLLSCAGILSGVQMSIAAESEGQNTADSAGTHDPGQTGEDLVGTDLPTENAVPKTEVVYGLLADNGTLESVYVVNRLNSAEAGNLVDFGDYSSVKNLTNTSPITSDETVQSLDASEGVISYEGQMANPELPWIVQLSYTLDGEPIEADQLGGASGLWGLQIDTAANTEVNPAFFDNYLLQVTVAMPASILSDIQAPDGQLALAGSDTQITFTGMPGEDHSFHITAQVRDFEMDGVSFAAVPMSFAFAEPDTSDLISGFEELGDGVSQLEDGADALADGAKSLANGVNTLASSAQDISTGADTMAVQTTTIAEGAQGIAQGLETYKSSLEAQAQALGAGVQDTSILIQTAIEKYSQAYAAAYGQAFSAALASGSDTATAMTRASATAAADPTATAALTQLAQDMGTTFGNQGAAEALAQAAAGLDADPSQSLVQAAQSLAEGLHSLAGGIDSFASGISSWADGAASTSQGATSLSHGAGELASGTQTLYREVKKMPDSVQEEIDAMMASYDKSDFQPISFVDPRNTNVELVQFVFTSPAITIPEEEMPEEEEVEETLFDRIRNLFG